MRIRILLAVALVVVLAGAAVGVLGYVKANSDGDQLRKARAQIKTLQSRVTDLAGAAAHQDTAAPSLSSVQSDLNALQSSVDTIVRACPDKDVNSYYQRLVGAQSAGNDESALIELLTTICPNIQQ